MMSNYQVRTNLNGARTKGGKSLRDKKNNHMHCKLQELPGRVDKTSAHQYQVLQFKSRGFQDQRSNHHERHLGNTSKITKKIKQQNGSGDSKKKINVSLHAKVVEFRHVCGEHLSESRQWVVT
jgi:hypothetical protein